MNDHTMDRRGWPDEQTEVHTRGANTRQRVAREACQDRVPWRSICYHCIQEVK